MMGEAERASKAWKNLLGVRYGERPNHVGKVLPQERVRPKPREYRWYTLSDGRRVFRPVIQHNDKRSDHPCPQISADYEAYDCPVTGEIIEGRRAHRENLKKQGCRILEPGEREQFKKDKPREIETRLDKDCKEATYAAARDYFV